MDSEWPGSISYSKNVFVANCSTPKETSESFIYKRLASSYLLLLSQSTLSFSADSFAPKLIQNIHDPHLLKKTSNSSPNSRSPSGSPIPIQLNAILSPELLLAFHSILCLVPKNLKFDLTRMMASFIQANPSPSIVLKLLPVLRESIKFTVCYKRTRPNIDCQPLQHHSGPLSVGNSSHGGIEKMQGLYRGLQKKDIEVVLDFLHTAFGVALSDPGEDLFSRVCVLLMVVDTEKKTPSYMSTDEHSMKTQKELSDTQIELMLDR